VRPALLPLVLSLSLPLGCAPAGDDALAIEVRLSSAEEVLFDVASFTLSVEGPDGPPLLARSFEGSERLLRLDAVPFGAHLAFVLVGLTSSGFGSARGQSCPVDIRKGAAYPSISLVLSRVGSFVPTASPPTAWRSRAPLFVRGDDVVMVAGGVDRGGQALASVDSYDPRRGLWRAEAPLSVARDGAEVASLLGGGALLAGGLDGRGLPLETLEVYRPGSGFSAVPARTVLGLGARATSLLDGRVLITGGAAPGAPARSASLIFEDGVVHEGGALAVPRRDHTVSVLGTSALAALFVLGGDGGEGSAVLGEVEVVDPRAGGSTPGAVVARLGHPRAQHTATVLGSGDILVVGGRDGEGPVADAETFDPITRAVKPAGRLESARRGHTATLLADGRVLIAGGVGAAGQPLRSVEIYDPVIRNFVTARPLSVERADHAAVDLCDGTILLVGGGAGAEIYNPAR
jgi:hypothetical protein